jgi:predicted ATPase
MKPLAFFALLAALVALGCASVDEATRNVRIEYQERGGLSASEYSDQEAIDEGMDSLRVEQKYFGGGK